MKNHKLEYPHNYGELKREIEYAISHLNMVINDIDDDNARVYVKRVVKDLAAKVQETEAALKNATKLED